MIAQQRWLVPAATLWARGSSSLAKAGRVGGRAAHLQSPAMAAAPQGFSGSSVDELESWLEQSGIDVASYGQAASKSVDLLLQEVQDGETVLTVDGGRPLRVVSVVNALVTNAAGQTLIEKHQVMPSGAVRERSKPLGEKMLPGESWREGVLRGIREELGPVLPGEPQVSIDEASYTMVEECKESQSYPGLLSKYIIHRVRVTVAGLPEGSFVTEEQRADGLLQHVWVWE